MGLFGWSYGGFMTTDFMLNHPGVFKAAVAGGPVMDWGYYEIMYTKDIWIHRRKTLKVMPQTDLTNRSKIKRKTLLIHGLQDPVVLQQNSVIL